MDVLVTGGAGFIGSHLVERLVAEGDSVGRVRVVDNLSTGKLENLRPFLSRVEFIHGDLLDGAVRERAVRGVEVIFHEAAIPSVPRSVEDPVETGLHTAHATLLLLDAARRGKVRRLVFAGSAAAYGNDPTVPKREEMLPQPCSPYAAAKLASEFYLQAFARCYDLDTVVLRYFNVFGPRQDPSSPYSGVISKFCSVFLRDEPLNVFGDGEQSRDFIYVSDVVAANLLAARHAERLQGEVFNVGTGQRITLNEMIRHLKELTGREKECRYGPPRAGDVRHSQADISRARTRLGFQPQVDFRTGLARTLAWFRGGLA